MGECKVASPWSRFAHTCTHLELSKHAYLNLIKSTEILNMKILNMNGASSAGNQTEPHDGDSDETENSCLETYSVIALFGGRKKK